jgi:hypothetical protein
VILERLEQDPLFSKEKENKINSGFDDVRKIKYGSTDDDLDLVKFTPTTDETAKVKFKSPDREVTNIDIDDLLGIGTKNDDERFEDDDIL